MMTIQMTPVVGLAAVLEGVMAEIPIILDLVVGLFGREIG